MKNKADPPPSPAVYKADLEKLINDNSLIIDAWYDDPNKPTFLHIRKRKTFSIYKCKISIPLASLKLIFHDGHRRATKPQV